MKILHAFVFACLLTICAPVFAQGTQVAFGTQQDKNAPIEVSANELDVDQKTNTAIFTGEVLIVQGEMRLAADRVLVVYRQETQGISKLEATGNVLVVSGEDAAESQYADYKVDEGLIEMTGDVLLTQGPNALTADRMTVRLDDGTARMEGRVKTILQPRDN